MNETFRKVEEHLRPWARGKPITPDTELYSDLGIYGDDFAFDVILWATREFGVEGTFQLDEYARGEMSVFLRPLAKLIGRNRGFYKSFKVSDLVMAIETKKWPQ